MNTSRDRQYILDDRLWPNIALPLKNPRRADASGWPLLAVLPNPPADEHSEVEIRIGLLFQPLRELPIERYPNVDQLLADGWIVD